MKNSLLILFVLLFIGQLAFAQETLDYYLPDEKYDKTIPTPEDVLGYQIGKWHVSHDQIVMYMREVAKASDRVLLEEKGRTHEDRPLLLLTITSAQNQKNLDQIQKDHIALTDAKNKEAVDLEKAPVVVYQGYSIHGNESSGSNASLLMVYYLAAAQGKEIEELLDNVIVLLDPCMNPDGLHRFSTWANMHKSKNLISDTESRELNEHWPRGRTNHYWFDLNRDWLLLQHPESQARVRTFHEWKPNILTDHHEMGANSTYFFQPGVPSRTNPLTPPKNQELTEKISTYHAAELDAIGSLYYSKESFDDFYYGKGSTYPDVNSCIGILFEQASSRGHAQDSDNGVLTFPFTIRNQVKTSFSTLKAAKALRTDLLSYQRDFYKNAQQESVLDGTKAFVVGTEADKSRLFHFVELLKQHQIDVYELSSSIRADGMKFDKENAFIIPLEQQQYRLIKAMFETRTTFTDSLFYDVSTWTLPLAFNLNYANVKGKVDLGEKVEVLKKPLGKVVGNESSYAYLFEWDEYYTPRALYQLLNKDLRVKVANQSFVAATSEGERTFDKGTIQIPIQNQALTKRELFNFIQQVARENGIQIFATKTGLTSTGIDFGSPNFSPLTLPKLMLVVGDGVTSYDAGEIWHLLDQRYDIPITLVEGKALGYADLTKYTTIVMANGSYSSVKGESVATMKDWIQEGGTLITIKGAARWATSNGLANVKFRSAGSAKGKTTILKRPYDKLRDDRGAQVIGGAIFNTTLDLTHPLLYGYNKKNLAVFRKGTLFFEPGKNPYSTPILYTNDPLLSGYISDQNSKLVRNSAGVIVTGMGSGRVISIADNPNFRAYWYGGNKLFANAIFFAKTISRSATESAPSSKKEEKKEDEDGHGHQH